MFGLLFQRVNQIGYLSRFENLFVYWMMFVGQRWNYLAKMFVNKSWKDFQNWLVLVELFERIGWMDFQIVREYWFLWPMNFYWQI